MLLVELFEKEEDSLVEGAKIAWARVGNKVVKKYRCTDGKRQGRILFGQYVRFDTIFPSDIRGDMT